jgi:D-alanyl-D-alanine carboxypeptidase
LDLADLEVCFVAGTIKETNMRNIKFLGVNTLIFSFLILAPVFTGLENAHAARKSAAMAIDAHTGRVLYSHNVDKPHHPASLTKIMTLYMMFEYIEAGRFHMNSPLKVTANAARQVPSKLGLKPGTTILVKDAIKALVTKSANDVAVTIAENLAGSEWKFTRLMTWKARKMGMNKTVFVNASGLPDKRQTTTARDMITLGMRIQKDFPQFYPLFSMKKFAYRGKVYKNHNGLMSRMRGIDGIKTGYTRASGFNLTSSIWSGRKHVVAVVLGGKTARKRDNFMARVLKKSLRKARRGKSKKQFVAANFARKAPRRKIAAVQRRAPKKIAPRKQVVAKRPLPRENSAPVKQKALVQKAALKKAPAKVINDRLQQELTEAPAQEIIVHRKKTALKQNEVANKAQIDPSDTTGDIKEVTDKQLIVTTPPQGPFHIQIGAFGTEEDAERRLHSIGSKAGKLLNGHKSFTMKVSSNNVYRARFAGFSEADARKTCRQLKKKAIDCMAISAQQ